MFELYLNGQRLGVYSTIPSTIKGVKVSRLHLLTDSQLRSHGLVKIDYTPPEPIPPTEEELAQQFRTACMAALQSMLDTKSREFGFESIYTAIAWGADRPGGAELKAWGKACWEAAEALEADIIAGTKPMPESIEAFISEIPIYAEGL